MVKTLVLVLIFFIFAKADDAGLSPVEIIEKYNYPCETHYITTEDGYILTFHRIPHGLNDDGTTARPAVLLVHGILSSSADFVNMGPGRSLAFLLADIGYDVWIGNLRGNSFSRQHVSLDIVDDVEQFFNFSWHEMGHYDLPAAIDHVLEINGDDSLYYVAHSQGCTSFLVLASTRPEYNNKIKVASLMAPVSFMDHQSHLNNILSKYIYRIEDALKKLNVFEVPGLDIIRPLLADLCSQPNNFDLCENIIGLVDGTDPDQLEQDKWAVIFTNFPSDSGIKQLYHYGQLIQNGGFRQYDYGTDDNLIIYGTEEPPTYDLSKISAPVALYYGKNDQFANVEDVQHLRDFLTNVAIDYLIPYEYFSHVDFLVAKDVVDLLYTDLIKTMQQF